jgi:trehalose/maltose transport system permease protein
MRERSLARLLIVAGSATLLVFVLAPVVCMVWISFTSRPDFLVTGSAQYSLDHYREVLGSRSLHFLEYLRNSWVVASVAAVAVTAMACVAAYAVSRLRFRGRIAIPLGILAVSMFPQISIVGALYRMFAEVGWINTLTALVLPYIALNVPLATWILTSTFAQLPRDLDRAALVDGATRGRTLRRVLLPVAMPGVLSSLLLVFIQCFNEFLFALLLTVDARAQTLPVGIALFEGVHGEIPWGSLMAASTLGSLPLVLLAFLCQRWVVAGLARGAVKG